MGQTKLGIWIAGFCAAVMLVSVGYGMGRRAATKAIQGQSTVTPAGAPLPTIQIEPIQPQAELAAIGEVEVKGTADVQIAGAAQATAPEVIEASDRVREIQQGLKLAGFNPGPIDGRLGPRTKSAVSDFQMAHGLEADGKVGPKTWSKLESFLSGTESAE